MRPRSDVWVDYTEELLHLEQDYLRYASGPLGDRPLFGKTNADHAADVRAEIPLAEAGLLSASRKRTLDAYAVRRRRRRALDERMTRLRQVLRQRSDRGSRGWCDAWREVELAGMAELFAILRDELKHSFRGA